MNDTVPELCRANQAAALFSMGNMATSFPPVPQLVLFHKAHFISSEPLRRILPTLREQVQHRLERLYFRYAIQHATVTVQTGWVRQRLLAMYRLRPEQVHVVPNAPDLAGAPDPAPGAQARQMASLQRPLRLFYLALYYPHKNHRILKEVADRLEALRLEEFAIVTTIAPDQDRGAQRLLQQMQRHTLGPRPRFLNVGPVPPGQIDHCFRQSWACLIPTLLETFGLTYLEAMRAGCPILTSDRDFAREVCGDAALYFDPLNADSIVQAILRLRDEPGLRERLIEAGRRRLQQGFPTWAEVTERYVELLRRIARPQAVS
ncbi:glycosyltransferase [Limisphaera sp. VF-2]|uniref:glycosyltransferase n=1 Tax=Limisphaera sp. VF-2 TaxID=3400418 RepID=UPI003C252EB2